MKRFIHVIFVTAMVTALIVTMGSCRKSDIPVYEVKDSAVCFESRSTNFSLRGVEDEKVEFSVGVEMIGPVVDYDRMIDVRVVSDDSGTDAVEGVDFTIKSAMVAAGQMKGSRLYHLRQTGKDDGK